MKTNTKNDNADKRFTFDRSFQEKIIQAMINDKSWATQINEVLSVEYFEFADLKLVASKYIGHFRKYKEFPSLELLTDVVKKEIQSNKELMNDSFMTPLKGVFERLRKNENLGDLSYVKDKTLDFCKKAELQSALYKSVDLIHKEKYEEIVNVIKKALASGEVCSSGMDLHEDVDNRYSETARRTVATGIQILDQRKILNGGLGGGELGAICAGPGAGKTHVLIQFGCAALLRKKNVLHYTFELSERATTVRYDSHLLDIDSLDCYKYKKDIREFYETKGNTLGKLKVKYFPTSTASVLALQGHLEKLKTHENFIPDLIIVDYAGIMRSTERYELLRLELKKVFEELRGWAAELDIPIWSAVQSNREGAEKDIIDLTNMAEAYAQAAVADVVIGLSRKSEQKSTGFGNIFIAKNRAGIDGLKFYIHLDTSRSKMRILTEEEARDFAANLAPQQNSDIIRRKFVELKNMGTKKEAAVSASEHFKLAWEQSKS